MAKRTGFRFPLGRAGLALLGLGSQGCPGRCNNVYFRAPVTPVAVADANGDGRLDLLGARPGSDGVAGILTVRLQDPAQRSPRRARRRPPSGQVLPQGGPELRQLQPLPRAHRRPRGRPGRPGKQEVVRSS